MRNRYKKRMIAAGLVVGGAAAISLIHGYAAHWLMGLALDRQEPPLFRRQRDRLLHSEPFRPLADAITVAAGKLESTAHEEVIITGHDGTLLVGHWFACHKPSRVIVAMHGWRSSWSQDFGAIAEFFQQQHCCVLYAEQRGQGESGGSCMGFGLSERHDCRQWAHWVHERTGGTLPIYLCGISMGGTTVLMTVGSDLPGSVKGIIADCAFTSPTAIWEHVAHRALHVPYGIYKAIADDIYHRKTQLDSREYSSVEAMKVCRVPVLFIHGAADRLVPVDMTYENYLSCAAEKHLLVVPGADHGMSYLTDRPRYEQAVCAFWQAHE